MSPPLSVLRLYVSEECELCDRAVDILAQAKAPDFECICIEGDEALEERYGVRVPVLRDVTDDRELGWPFDVADVRNFLGARSAIS
jgi:glutaredoxin 2